MIPTVKSAYHSVGLGTIRRESTKEESAESFLRIKMQGMYRTGEEGKEREQNKKGEDNKWHGEKKAGIAVGDGGRGEQAVCPTD